MALEIPEARKVHITRIFGVNRSGEILPDMYADLLRVEQMRSSTQREYNRTARMANMQQTVTLRPRHWQDKDGTDGPEDSDADLVETEYRDFELLKLVPPDEENPDDPEEWIPVRLPKRIKMIDSGFSASRRFITLKDADDDIESRKKRAVRVNFFETNIDIAAEAAAEAGDKTYYISPEDVQDYEKDLETEDKDTYIEYEIITRFRTRKGRSHVDSYKGDQGLHFNLKNKFLIDDANGEATGEEGKIYRFDPFQNVININWGGLAVEFEKNEYITLAETIPDHKKAIGCMWFRIPSESYQEAKDDFDEWEDDSTGEERPPFIGIIPLMTMGPSVSVKKTTATAVAGGGTGSSTFLNWTGSTDPPDCTFPGEWEVSDETPSSPTTGTVLSFTGDMSPVEPCCIGVDCTGDEAKLFINLVLPNQATITGWRLIDATVPGVDMIFNTPTPNECGGLPGYERHGEGGCETICVHGIRAVDISTSYVEAAQFLIKKRPEVITTTNAARVGVTSDTGGTTVELDHWHCLIFAYDVTPNARATGYEVVSVSSCADTHSSTSPNPNEEGRRVTSTPRLYVAFDDEPKVRKELSYYWPRGYNKDPNGVLPVNGMLTLQHSTEDSRIGPDDDCLGNTVTITNYSGPVPTYSFTPADLPTSQGSMAFPAGEEYADEIKRVQMGPFTMFLDVVANPSDIEVRRLFVTDRGRPASMNMAKEYFEKRPEIALRRVKHWQKAKNIGSLNTDPDQYGEVVGEIERYRPNPNLYDEQGE